MTRTKRTIFLMALTLGLLAQWGDGLAYGQALVMPVPRLQFELNTGANCNGCKLYTYLANSTTPQALYTNSALSVSAPNPVVMNSSGRPSVSGTETNLYQPAFNMKFVLYTSGDVLIWTADNVRPSASAMVLPTSFAVGDILYADTTSTLAKLPDVAAGSYLRSGGVSTAPVWSTATLPNTATTGDVLYASATNTYANLTAGTSGTFLQANGAGMAPSWAAAGATDKSIVQGRLSLTSATPVTTADVTAATTLYWALYGGNQISLYTGTAWTTVSIAQLSITMVGLTASKPYDVFIDYTAGVPALELVVWTNDTTRATALATQDGVYVQTADADSRYVGTIYIDSGGGAVTDSYALRHVWNYYNRVVRLLRAALETADTWTYTTATIRQANANAANQLDFVVGVAEVGLDAILVVSAEQTNADVDLAIGIGLDTTSAFTTGSLMPYGNSNVANRGIRLVATLQAYPAAGRHFASWNEYSAAGVGTTTWDGDRGVPTRIQSGISGSLEM